MTRSFFRTPAITMLLELNLLLIWTCAFLFFKYYALILVDLVKICKSLILLVKGHDWLCQRLLRDLKIMQKHFLPCQLLLSIFQACLQANDGFHTIFWKLSNILIICLPCRYLFVCKWFFQRPLTREVEG